MNLVLDPLHRLITQESIRFIGTTGDATLNAPELYLGVVSAFDGREVRGSADLISVVMNVRRQSDQEPMSDAVARHTVEVAAALRLVLPVTGFQNRSRRYVLDESGRVASALYDHPAFATSDKRQLLLLRPMFEANGDYLLQALEAIDKTGDTVSAVEHFRNDVRQMAEAKVAELPINRSGVKWEAYVAGLRARRNSIMGVEQPSSDARASLDEIQRQRKKAKDSELKALRERRHGSTNVESLARAPSETKTIAHHFARSRAWLEGLGLVRLRERGWYELTERGIRLRDYFSKATGNRSPMRIPPTFTTLQDCFRIESDEAQDIWGCVVDDEFWERAILSLEESGFYEPSAKEGEERFQRAFDKVKISQISEATLAPLRQVLFLEWLADGKPVKPKYLSDLVLGDDSVPRRHPNRYGYGRNRQGRIAYLFRKDAT